MTLCHNPLFLMTCLKQHSIYNCYLSTWQNKESAFSCTIWDACGGLSLLNYLVKEDPCWLLVWLFPEQEIMNCIKWRKVSIILANIHCSLLFGCYCKLIIWFKLSSLNFLAVIDCTLKYKKQALSTLNCFYADILS